MHAQIWLKISVRHSFGPVIILRGYDFISRSSLKYWFICTQFQWKRTCDTNMRDNNFFATKTLACGTKTWPITISLHQNIHVRHANLAENSGRPFQPMHACAQQLPENMRGTISTRPKKDGWSKIYQRPVQNTSNSPGYAGDYVRFIWWYYQPDKRPPKAAFSRVLTKWDWSSYNNRVCFLFNFNCHFFNCAYNWHKRAPSPFTRLNNTIAWFSYEESWRAFLYKLPTHS